MLRVLLVEDDALQAQLVGTLLEHAGVSSPYGAFRTAHVTCLRDALLHLGGGGIDVVLLDLGLPDAEDLEALEAALHAAPHVPMVVLTGAGEQELAQRALVRGAEDFLSKLDLDADGLARALVFAKTRADARRQAAGADTNLLALFDAHPDGMAVVSPGGHVRYANAQAAATLKALGDEALGALVTAYRRGGSATAPPSLSARGTDGLLREYEPRITPVRWQGEDALLVALRDHTDSRRLANLSRELEHTDRLVALGRLAAGVAHEVNNPATYVLGNLGVMLEQLDGLEALPAAESSALRMPRGVVVAGLRELVEDCREGMARIRHIVGDLRVFSRAQGDQLRPTDLRPVVARAGRLVRREVDAGQTRYDEVLEVGGGVGDPWVMGDDTRLVQLVTNLLVNALHAATGRGSDGGPSPSAEPRIGLTLAPQRGPSGEAGWCVSVADSGPGVPEPMRDRVFAPFFTTKPRGLGTGLGLSIARDIATAHQGRLTVEGRSGALGGAVFRLWLPATDGR